MLSHVMKNLCCMAMLLFIITLPTGCNLVEKIPQVDGIAGEITKEPSPVEKIPPEERGVSDLVVLGARSQVEKGVAYEASYEQIDYPGGDVPSDRGVCTDVVIRAYRNAGLDLQQLIHEDMENYFELYPQDWGLKGPDANIDHRRVPNQMKFFERHGETLALSTTGENLSQWHWGDVVYWKFDNGLDHCGIISDRKSAGGVPLVIHNAGLAREEDCLNRWQITGHYRYEGTGKAD